MATQNLTLTNVAYWQENKDLDFIVCGIKYLQKLKMF